MTLETLPAPPSGKPAARSASKRESSSAREREGILVEIPGSDPASWRRWSFPQEGAPISVAAESSSTESQSSRGKARRFVTLPSSALFVWPLWIAPEGDAVELARMELSGRHLLKRGMEESLSVLPLDVSGDRRLVLAMATEEPFPSEQMPANWLEADGFGIPPELIGEIPQGEAPACELLVWKEHGQIFAGFRRQGRTVWFSRATERELAGLLRLIVLKLVSEGTLPGHPSSILLSGLNNHEAERLGEITRRLFPSARTSILSEETPPRFAPERLSSRDSGPDLAPAEAKAFRIRAKNRERLLLTGWIIGLVYLLLILWGTGDLMIRHAALSKLRAQATSMKTPASEAHRLSDRWNALRSAVDPSTYPLDILAAIAAPTEGGKVRLISVVMENGHLQIAGEATDVTQAYGFMEALKKNALLQQFDWTTGQPQLAGKESVKFEMEGTRPHANP